MLAAEDNADVREALESVGKVTDGLESFLLKPKGMKSIELLEHMHAFAMRDPTYQLRIGEPLMPSAHLDAAITDEQCQLFVLAWRDLTMHELMKDAGGLGATMKIAKRKLNLYGAIQSHSGLANDEKQLQKLKNKTMLAALIAEIDQRDKNEANAKSEEELKNRCAVHSDAVVKLANNQGNVSKLTKIEIAAILLVGHSIDVGPMTRKANKKEALVARLEERIKASIDGSILATCTSAIDASGESHMDLDSDSDGQAVPGGHVQEHDYDEA